MSAHGNVAQTAMDAAPAATYTAGGTTLVLWGLHISDIAVIVSTLATVFGVALQFYVALHRIRTLEKAQVAQTENSAANTSRIEAVETRQADIAQTTQVVLSKVRNEGDNK